MSFCRKLNDYERFYANIVDINQIIYFHYIATMSNENRKSEHVFKFKHKQEFRNAVPENFSTNELCSLIQFWLCSP